MNKLLTVGHSFNSGDLISILPGLHKAWQDKGIKTDIYQRLNLPADYGFNFAATHPVQHEGQAVCMNKATFDMMKTLIESQPYINFFLEWKGEEVEVNYDNSRHDTRSPIPGGSIYKWPSLSFPELEADDSLRWLYCDPDDVDYKLVNSIIINRTFRYHNAYLTFWFLKEFEKELLFAGTKEEHEAFCKMWELDMPLLVVKDFLELAGYIAACRFFLGNQSFCWHLANALKVPRMVEICPQYPNSFPSGKDGYSFVTQAGLEYNFHRLYNQTK